MDGLRRRRLGALGLLALLAVGCTGPRQWIEQRFKVGPEYCRPAAPVAADWIDAADVRVRSESDDLAGWWTLFDDPLLDSLMRQAYGQNLTLREAGYRVLAARAQLGFARGNLGPQFQTASGGFTRFGIGDAFFDQWNLGFNLAWELDFWGRFRRAILSAQANLAANCADYDDVLVTLLADVATNYVNYRTTEERIRLLERVILVQEEVVEFIETRLEAGARGVTDLDRAQARSNLESSRAQLSALELEQRFAQNQLCILLGMPVTDLTAMLASGPRRAIPTAPQAVVVGVPAELLRRRPDVRRAERLAAAQAQQIGIAVADLYPAFSITGTLGWQAGKFSDLFSSASLNSSVGPSFQWNLLNYGRIESNILFQDARFRELVAAYQSAVLRADLEAENGIATFLRAREQAEHLRESVAQSELALEVALANYEAGVRMANFDFNRYAVILQNLILQQDQWAQARGRTAAGLVETYRALGGGWQIRRGVVPDKRDVLGDGPGLVQPLEPAAPAVVDEPLPLPPAEDAVVPPAP